MNDHGLAEAFAAEILLSIGWQESQGTPWFKAFYLPGVLDFKNEIWISYKDNPKFGLLIWGRSASGEYFSRQRLDLSDPDIKKQIIEYANRVR